MGNASSSRDRHDDDTVDLGALTPQGGIYTSAGPSDYNPNIVAQLIVQRKLAPFYRPLEDYEEDWDDERILAARKKVADDTDGTPFATPSLSRTPTRDGGSSRGSHHMPLQSATSALRNVTKAHHRSSNGKEKERESALQQQRALEAQLYRGAAECPICFMYYPPNINQTRCCDQAICTECFVQIKRADPTTTHIVSEPACCPYCMQPNFGVTYTPPTWRAGIGSDGSAGPSPARPEFFTNGSSSSSLASDPTNTEKRRRKSVSHTSRDVVTVDMVHPDWEAKLNAVRAAVARRAARRIVMRQVGDRLIPVGITSGRVVSLPPGTEGTTEEGSGSSSRRRRRREHGTENEYLGPVIAGPDLEELMIAEAMRLSMIEEDARQRRAAEQEAANGGGTASSTNSTEPTPTSSSLLSASVPTTSNTTLPPSQSSTTTPLSSSSINLNSPSASSRPAPQSQSVSRSPSYGVGGIASSVALAIGSPRTSSDVSHERASVEHQRGSPSLVTAALGRAAGTAHAALGSSSSPSPPAVTTSEAVHPSNDTIEVPATTALTAGGVETPALFPSTDSDLANPEAPLNHDNANPNATVAPAHISLPSQLPPVTSTVESSTPNPVVDIHVVPSQQDDQQPLPTPMSMMSDNSEAPEEYNWLPSSPTRSILTEEEDLTARAPLIGDAGDLFDGEDSEGTVDGSVIGDHDEGREGEVRPVHVS